MAQEIKLHRELEHIHIVKFVSSFQGQPRDLDDLT